MEYFVLRAYIKYIINYQYNKVYKFYYTNYFKYKNTTMAKLKGISIVMISPLIIIYYLFTIKDSPDISAGTSNPISVNIVGAISANFPVFNSFPSVWFATQRNGTGPVV